ncbi:MAG: PLP-dependent cysteine synthase family protein [Candidatus Ranarchaeia archaeon]
MFIFVKRNLIDFVGNTPLVELRTYSSDKVKIFGKLEAYNPSGSIKDRIAKFMIECAEKKGLLTKDKIILEPTSGNTGIGLALISAIKGYRITLVMPENMSIERRLIMKAYGADLILTPAEEGVDGSIKKVKELSESSKQYLVLDQFSNPCNVKAHWENTGMEIWDQMDGDLTHFVAGIGTGGTLMGAGGRLKDFNPEIKIVAVEPNPETPIQGLKNLGVNKIPPIWVENKIDLKINVSLKESYQMAKDLVKHEGIFAGISSGATLSGALKLKEKIDSGKIVVILADSGAKYLSTPLFNGDK